MGIGIVSRKFGQEIMLNWSFEKVAKTLDFRAFFRVSLGCNGTGVFRVKIGMPSGVRFQSNQKNGVVISFNHKWRVL